MPAKLSTTVSKIANVPNQTNAAIITDFHVYMRSNGASESHQNNNLKTAIAFASFLGPHTSFYDLSRKEQILAFLDTKIKSQEEDPDKKWITTWNHYLRRIKLFLRWLYNSRLLEKDEGWETPDFARIKERRTKRLSPYSETEIWERHELLTIIKYERYTRNKAALALMWDLDARNHEVTLLKIKNIRFKDTYAEGEVPHESKTGTGPILLTFSFPYVRDWLNEHPFKNNSDARLICNLYSGAPIRSDALWTMMKQLRKRIVKLLEQEGAIRDVQDREALQTLLKTKKWNPYCIRHSAITADSDFLPEYALKKKVRWSMNSRQGARYIKRTMGNDLKREILARSGIVSDDCTLKAKPAVSQCSRCRHINTAESKVCSKCGYPLVFDEYERLKESEIAEAKEMIALKEKSTLNEDAIATMAEQMVALQQQIEELQKQNSREKPASPLANR
jgi:integrase/recombinase XerD